jgi:hypothetical protein
MTKDKEVNYGFWLPLILACVVGVLATLLFTGQSSKQPVLIIVTNQSQTAESARTSPTNSQSTIQGVTTSIRSETRAPSGTSTIETNQIERPYSKVYALVIGNEDYSSAPHLSTLRFARADCAAVGDVFTTNYGFQVTMLTNRQATLGAITNQLATSLAEMTPQDDVVVYFVGHGLTEQGADGDRFNRTAYLIPYGARLSATPTRSELETQALNVHTLIRMLEASRCRHRVLFIDACVAGLATIDAQRASLPGDSFGNPLSEPSLQVLTAGTASESAFAIDRLRDGTVVNHGLFTHALLLETRGSESHSILKLFINVRERMLDIASQEFAGRLCSPQHRMLLKRNGEFFLIPVASQPRWLASRLRWSDAADNPRGGQYLQPFTPFDFTNLVAAARESDPSAVSARARLESRAALGDGVALALLTELDGRAAEPARRARAGEWARLGYESGQPHGIYALSRAYRNGYGLPPNEADADELERRSGLGKLGEILNAVGNLAQTAQKLSGTYSITNVAEVPNKLNAVWRGVKDVGKGIGDAFRLSAVARVGRIRTALADRKGPAWAKIHSQLREWQKDVDKMPENSTTRTTLQSHLEAMRRATTDSNSNALTQTLAKCEQLLATQPTEVAPVKNRLK